MDDVVTLFVVEITADGSEEGEFDGEGVPLDDGKLLGRSSGVMGFVDTTFSRKVRRRLRKGAHRGCVYGETGTRCVAFYRSRRCRRRP